MNGIKVSVVVPVYNAERFLRECLDSLIGQTLEEIEILCVNDGSTDGSLKILKKYEEQDKRVKVIDKNNSGYGDSVNLGIKKARGEYIGIVEPDDFVDLNTFEKMYKTAKKSNADVVKCNFYNYANGKDISKSDLFLKDEIDVVVEPRKKQHIFYQQPSVWSAIYKKSFLCKNEIEFLASAGASYQDAGFTFKVWAMAKRVVFMNEAFLHYRNDNPASSVKSEGKLFAVKDEYDEVESYLAKMNELSVLGPVVAAVRLGGYIWNMRRLKWKKARVFAKIVKSDYERYEKMGYLKLKNFKDEDALFIVKNIIVRKPMVYLYLRQLYEFWDGFKRWGYGLKKEIKKGDTIVLIA